jgi:pyridoxal phosphate enzyme (YggS family)
MSFPFKDKLSDRLLELNEALSNACQAAGRNRDDVCLVGVSKKHPSALIREAHDCGLRDFGENYVQEWDSKAEALSSIDLRWHFVGALQRNKVRFVVGRTHLIHSVDRLSLAQAIGKRAQELDLIQDVLLQVSVASEASKGGIAPEELNDLYESCRQISGLRVRGLMVFPPFVEDPEQNRAYFALGHQLLNNLKREHPDDAQKLTELSMGMSGDFQVAIEEGATLIRVGTKLFGHRTS